MSENNSSRICVKNLPKNCTEATLKDTFSSRGEVTDVKLIRDKATGAFRKFAFVGFRSAEQASDAQKYFHNTFIGMSKIFVEIARKYNDPVLQEKKQKLQRSSEPPKEQSPPQSIENKNEKDPKKNDAAVNKKKEEFLQLMKRRSEAATWDNDGGAGPADAAAAAAAPATAGSNSDDVDGAGSFTGSDDDSDDDSDESVTAPATAATAAAVDAPVSDLDYLRSKTVRRDSISDTESEASDDDDDDDDDDNNSLGRSGDRTEGGRTRRAPAAPDAMDGDDGADDAAATGLSADSEAMRVEDEEDDVDNSRLFVKNLPFTCTEEELTALFAPFGPLSEVHMPIDSVYKRSKGFAFVQFLLPEHAHAAQEQLTGTAFQGRVLYVVVAKAKDEGGDGAAAAGQPLRGNAAKLSAFQRKKEEERRKNLNKRDGWNAAHVRSDAVVETLAERHGVTAADILDVTKSGGDIAVNLAIGESQVIMENKEYFALHGVDIDALESAHSSAKAQKRSSTTLLVKNLPPRADASELESMFARFGALGAFLLPSSKTLALADFVEPSEARAAFKGLAYRSYKHAPLYLEWAPVDVIDKNKLKKAMSNQNKQQKQQQQQQQQAQRSGAAAAAAEGDDDDDDDAIYSSVFIKNLNFSTTDQNLRDHIVRIGAGEGLRTAVIRKKTKEASSGSGSGGAVSLSQGFGFAEYSSHALAARAVQLLHGSVLDMHTLEVKPSDKRLTAPPATATGKSKGNGAFQHTTTNSNSSSNASSGAAAASEHTDAKVIVRNVAFQATKSEIRNLFAAYSSVRRVRIPKKMNGEHRGFAFVDFSSSREAEAAIAALKNAHLYGRHLVIEWAKSDDDGQHEDIEQLRKKARRSEKSFAPSSLHEQF